MCIQNRFTRRCGIGRKLAIQAQAARLLDRHAVLQCELLDGRQLCLQTAAGRPVRLGQHQRDRMARPVQMFQRDARELGGAGEDQAHATVRVKSG